MIALVRHAEAGLRGSFEHDELRPLTAEGWAQAAALVALLAPIRFARVLSSPYLRCGQTLEPLAAARGLVVEDTGALEEGAGKEPALRLIADLAAAGAALCSHGDVIGEVIHHLSEDGVIPRDEVRYPKGSTWLLDVEDGRLATARYLPPPSVG